MTKDKKGEAPQGILAMGERFLANDWVGLVAFALLLTTLDLTAWQAILAITIFVQRTTPLPTWLVRERALAATPPVESRP